MRNRSWNLVYGTAWKAEKTSQLVQQAYNAGFRAFDTACQKRHYDEQAVGEALKEIPREQTFLQTKFTGVEGHDEDDIPYDPNASIDHQIRASVQCSLNHLNTDYIDSYLLHSPLDTYQETLDAYRVLEDLHRDGTLREIGISNVYNPKLFKNLYSDAHVKPTILQNRFYYATGFDSELRQFCAEKDIMYQSFWTLTANVGILQNTNIQKIALELNRTVPQVWFRYIMHLGVIPLVGTTNSKHMKEDLDVPSIVLSADQLSALDHLMASTIDE